MILHVGDNPALCHCRICGTVSVPPYPGYYRDAICSRVCFEEWQWRDTLHILRKPYRPHGEAGEGERTPTDPSSVRGA